MGGDLCISGCSPKLAFVRFLMFPRIGNLDPLGNWFLCSVTLTIIIYFRLNGIFCFSVCAHWLLLCHWIRLRVWLCFLISSHQIFLHIDQIPLRLLHAEQASLCLAKYSCSFSTSLPTSGYAPVCPCLLCTREPRPGHSAPDVSYWDLVGGKDHCPEPADNTFQSIGY